MMENDAWDSLSWTTDFTPRPSQNRTLCGSVGARLLLFHYVNLGRFLSPRFVGFVSWADAHIIRRSYGLTELVLRAQRIKRRVQCLEQGAYWL